MSKVMIWIKFQLQGIGLSSSFKCEERSFASFADVAAISHLNVKKEVLQALLMDEQSPVFRPNDSASM